MGPFGINSVSTKAGWNYISSYNGKHGSDGSRRKIMYRWMPMSTSSSRAAWRSPRWSLGRAAWPPARRGVVGIMKDYPAQLFRPEHESANSHYLLCFVHDFSPAVVLARSLNGEHSPNGVYQYMLHDLISGRNSGKKISIYYRNKVVWNAAMTEISLHLSWQSIKSNLNDHTIGFLAIFRPACNNYSVSLSMKLD